MIIPLGNDTRAEVILSVLGQLSDGIWENSSAMNKYWQFADVEGTDLVIDDEPFVYERDYSSRGYKTKSIRNGFSGMTEKQIRDWFANKAKQVVKIWAEDYGKDPKAVWSRNNLDEVTYMGHHRMDVTVADVYECYDFLKGRGGHEYGVSKEPAPVEVDEVVEPEVSGGMNPSQEEVEDFFLDASTNIKCGTKYPKGYVKADTEATGVDYYLDRIADGISWALDVSTQTALDLINAMQLDEDDLEGMGFTHEEYPEFYN